MATYVALMRGFGPGNPNMRGEALKGAFESLGFSNVTIILGSGNVVFESAMRSTAALEKKIEAMLPVRLGYSRIAIVRSRTSIEELLRSDPFKKSIPSEHYRVVTFFKDGKAPLPSAIDTKKESGPEFMRRFEKEFGKAITTRTWKTVSRILKKMEDISATA